MNLLPSELGPVTIALLLAVAATIVFTALAPLGGRHWIFSIISQFRPQYAVLLLAAIVWLCVERSYAIALLAAPALLANLRELIPFYRSGRSPGIAGHIDESRSSSSHPLHLFFCNVHADNGSYHRLILEIAASAADVVLLIEVSNEGWMRLNEELGETYRHRAHTIYRGEKFGAAILSRHPLIDVRFYVEEREEETAGGPCLVARIAPGGFPLTFIVGHPLPPQSTRWFRLRRKYLDDLFLCVGDADGEVIVVGDFNGAPWDPEIRDRVRRSPLRDGRCGFGIVPTWPSLFPPLMIPLDHVLVSEGIDVVSLKRSKRIGSDHVGLNVDFRFSNGE